MRRCGRLMIWCAMLICALALPRMLRMTPFSTEGLSARKYDGWAGVLRVWIVSGWETGGGSFSSWLNRCAAQFEKRYPGVYIQSSVKTQADLDGLAANALAPDMLLISPGVLSAPERLCQQADWPALREGLRDCGRYAQTLYATPVAMGGYAWAINLRMIEEVPYDWSALAPFEPVKEDARYAMQAPADDEHTAWSAALLHLMAPRPRTEYAQPEQKAGEGLDIGLAATPTPTPAVIGVEYIENRLPAPLPPDFRACASALPMFLAGHAAAIPVTQSEIHALQRQSAQGRAPDWRIRAGGGAFTDQLLALAIVDNASEPRRQLSEAFRAHLLSDASQAALQDIGALGVTDEIALYTAGGAMAQLESVLSGTLTAATMFDDQWRMSAKRQADQL